MKVLAVPSKEFPGKFTYISPMHICRVYEDYQKPGATIIHALIDKLYTIDIPIDSVLDALGWEPIQHPRRKRWWEP